MPRRERPLEGDNNAVIEFAADLRRLRVKAGNPSYRELAARAHYSHTTLAEAAAGRKLPSLEVTLAYVRACDGDVAEWETRWRAAADDVAAVGATARAAEERPPYMGLAAFGPQDADRFLGRERVVDSLVQWVSQRRLIAVAGPSGAGKSSLLRAGLVPRMSAERHSVLFTPGAHPLDECAVHLARFARLPTASVRRDLADPQSVRLLVRHVLAEREADELVLVVDQFEELFSLCADADERDRFLGLVLELSADEAAHVRVVLGVRADFISQCAGVPRLAAALQKNIFLIGPMDPAELRRVIVQPAADAGCSVEGALVATLIVEAVGRAGVLPLLSHVLLEVWRRRRGNALTLAAYEATGGMASAMKRTAEEIYGELNDREKQVARRVFLRLVALGEGTEDTKRRVGHDELDRGDPGFAAVVDRFVRARLLVLGEDGIELAHEALIGGWPRLRAWLAEDREVLRAHRRLTETALEWDRHDRDEDLLYRSAQLLVWQDRDLDGLSDLERRFLAAGRHRAAREHDRGRRRTRLLVAGLVSVLVVVSGLGSLAFVQGQRAADERDSAVSRQLALQARRNLELDPERAVRLAQQAFAVKPTAEAEATLRQAVADYRTRAVVAGGGGRVLGVAFSRDGKRLATTSEDGTARVWDWNGDHVAAEPSVVLRGHDGEVWSPAFSPDGDRLVTAGLDGTVRIWDLRGTVGSIVLRGHEGSVWGVAFSPDGQRVASAGNDGTVRIWDSRASGSAVVLRGHVGVAVGVAFRPDGRQVASTGHDHTVRIWNTDGYGTPVVLQGHEDQAKGVAFSPDGKQLVSASVEGTARVWTPGAPTSPTVLRGHQGTVEGVAFSPDGHRVATTSDDNTIRVWNSNGGGHPLVLHGHKDTVWAVAFSPDGRRLASASTDGTVRIWDPRGAGDPVVLRGHEGLVNVAVYMPNGDRVVSGGADGTVRVWDLAAGSTTQVFRGHGAEVVGLDVSGDGRRIASTGRDGTIHIWDVEGERPPIVLRGHRGVVWTASFSSDGALIASAGSDGTLRVWKLAEEGNPLIRTADAVQVRSAVFSPDGTSVATGGADGTVRIWDTTGRRPPRILRSHADLVWSLAFSPDGRHLASSGRDGTVRIWDLTASEPPVIWRGHQGFVWHLAYSPDRQSLASTGLDGSVRIWRASTAGESVSFTGFAATVESVAFGPDSSKLVTSHDDGTVRIWNCGVCGSVDHVLALARTLVPPG